MKQYDFIRRNKIVSALILLILSIIVTIIPVRDLLGESIKYPDAILVEALIVQGILLILSCIFLKIVGDNKSLGIRFENKIKDLYVIWPLVIFFILSIAGSIEFIDGVNVKSKTIILYIVTFIITALFEEFMLRGVALKVFIDKYKNHNKGIIKAVVVSSLVFALCSLNMLFSGQADLVTVVLKIFNMFCLGVLYCSIFLRTKSIWINVILHSLIELAGSIQALTITSKEAYESLIASSAVTMEMSVQIIIMSIPFLLIGLFFLRKVK